MENYGDDKSKDDFNGPEGSADNQDKIQKQNEEVFKKYFSNTQEETKQNLNEKVKVKSSLEEFNEFFDEHDLELSGSISIDSEFFKNIKGINIGLSLCKTFGPDIESISISLFRFYFIELAFVIEPEIEAGICIELGFDLNLNEKEYSFYIDAYGKAEASVSVEVGVYVPSSLSSIKVGLSLGLKGVLGSGRAGIKLSLFFNRNRYDTTVYFEANAFMLSFYIRFKFSIDYKIYSFTYEFYIIDKILFGLKFETHSTAVRFYNSTRKETEEETTLSCLLIKKWNKYKGQNCLHKI